MKEYTDRIIESADDTVTQAHYQFFRSLVETVPLDDMTTHSPSLFGLYWSYVATHALARAISVGLSDKGLETIINEAHNIARSHKQVVEEHLADFTKKDFLEMMSALVRQFKGYQ